MKHHMAEHAGDEVGGVVGQADTAHEDTLEIPSRKGRTGRSRIPLKDWMHVQYPR